MLSPHLLRPNSFDASPELTAVIDAVFDRYADATDPHAAQRMERYRFGDSAVTSTHTQTDMVMRLPQLTRLLVQHHPSVRLVLACAPDSVSASAPAAAGSAHTHGSCAPSAALQRLVDSEMAQFRTTLPSQRIAAATAVSSSPVPVVAAHSPPHPSSLSMPPDSLLPSASSASPSSSAPSPVPSPSSASASSSSSNACYSRAWLAHDIATALYEVEIEAPRAFYEAELHRNEQSPLKKLAATLTAKRSAAAAAPVCRTPDENTSSVELPELVPGERAIRRSEFHRLMLHALLDNPSETFRLLRSLGYDRKLQRAPPSASPAKAVTLNSGPASAAKPAAPLLPSSST